jgi:RNA polymerase sigma factor (sigma-70 family)
MDHPSFHLPDAWRSIVLSSEGELPTPLPVSERPSGPLRDLIVYPSPTHERTRGLILRMNFFKFKAAQLVEAYGDTPLPERDLRAALDYLRLAKETKDVIVTSNLRIAIKLANRFSRSSHVVEDLVSVGSETLMRTCESYDCTQPFQFYTYATRALLSNYARSMQAQQRLSKEERLEDVPFQEPADTRGSPLREARNLQALSSSIDGMLERLRERESLALRMRALDDETLLTIGKRLGISKQGAQGIIDRALATLQRRLTVDPRDDLL